MDEQVHVGLLGVVQPIQAQIGLAPVLDSLSGLRRERQCAFVALERAIVVAELPQRIARSIVCAIVVGFGGSRR